MSFDALFISQLDSISACGSIDRDNLTDKTFSTILFGI